MTINKDHALRNSLQSSICSNLAFHMNNYMRHATELDHQKSINFSPNFKKSLSVRSQLSKENFLNMESHRFGIKAIYLKLQMKCFWIQTLATPDTSPSKLTVIFEHHSFEMPPFIIKLPHLKLGRSRRVGCLRLSVCVWELKRTVKTIGNVKYLLFAKYYIEFALQ